MAVIRSFRELNVHKTAGRAARRVFEVTRGFPKDERFSLTDQIRRASRAANAMIAEAWARWCYPAVFRAKLDEALGEATETQAWLDHAVACGYVVAITPRTAGAGPGAAGTAPGKCGAGVQRTRCGGIRR